MVLIRWTQRRKQLVFVTNRVEIVKFLPYYKFGPNLENYHLATTWRMSWMWHEANLDPRSIVVPVTAPSTLAVLVFLDRLQS